MKRLIFAFIVFLIFFNPCFANNELVPFILFRMDYLSEQTKYLYYFTQPFQMTLPDSEEQVYHDFYVKIIPAGDFGRTVIRSRLTGKRVYEATTVWNGSGEHIYPPTPEMAKNQIFSQELPELKFLDYEDYFFQNEDYQRAQDVWNKAVELAPLEIFGEGYYGGLVYLHYFSVGVTDPSTAEWIVLLYKILPEIPVGIWKNISGNLPDLYINDVHDHFAFEDTIYVATRSGIFRSEDGGGNWQICEFSNDSKVNVTVVEAVPNPWVDCLCEVVYVGTEEYSMIPEDRRGRIFCSMDDGNFWEDTNFPDTAVTAIGINPLNPLTAFASTYNPFYYSWGLYRRDGASRWKKLPLKNADNSLLRINCIAVCPQDTNLILVGSDAGLFISRDNGEQWKQHLAMFSISSIQFFKDQIFVTTFGNTRSDGIYRSSDQGENWEVYTYWLYCAELVTGRGKDGSDPGYFFLADTIFGVSVSRESSHSWQNISETLPEKSITSLGYNLTNPCSILAGTINGVYKYEPVMTNIADRQEADTFFPEKIQLLKGFPNPFNSSIKIRYYVRDKNIAVRIAIYNILGEQIRLLRNSVQSAGFYEIIWDGRDKSGTEMPSGVYFCLIESNRKVIDRLKLILLK